MVDRHWVPKSTPGGVSVLGRHPIHACFRLGCLFRLRGGGLVKRSLHDHFPMSTFGKTHRMNNLYDTCFWFFGYGFDVGLPAASCFVSSSEFHTTSRAPLTPKAVSLLAATRYVLVVGVGMGFKQFNTRRIGCIGSQIFPP